MATGIVSTITEFAGLLQILFIVFGLTLAVAGRFIHDLVIYLSGFVAGASTGGVIAPAIVLGLELGPGLELVASIDLDIDAALALVEPFSLLFVAIVVVGCLIQFGAVIGGYAEVE